MAGAERGKGTSHMISSCDKNTPYAKGATTHHLCSGSLFMIAYFRQKVSGSKSGSSQKRVMISV